MTEGTFCNVLRKRCPVFTFYQEWGQAVRKFSIFKGILILGIVLMVCVLGYAFINGKSESQEEEMVTSAMASATIPTITMQYGEETLNCLQGYTVSMDKTSLSTVLTPVEDSKELVLNVSDCSLDISTVEYTIYREDRKTAVESRRTDNFTQSEEGWQVTLNLANSVSENEEYFLEIVLDSNDGDSVYYYTRLLLQDDFDAGDLTQTFIGTKRAFVDQSLLLGIVSESSVEYVYDETNHNFCWEQAGELWLYQSSGNQLYKIFSLQDTQWGDKRSFMQDYDIHILEIDEDNNVDFVVCGYFNRGVSEGTVSIWLCHYSGESNSYEVRYVIEDTRSADQLCADLEKLTYLSEDAFYYYQNGSVWRVNLETDEVSEIASGLEEDGLLVSKNSKMIAWIEDYDQSESMTLMDLSSGEKTLLQAEEGNYIRPIGFVGTDFVYGQAKADAVLVSETGEVTFPMYTVLICDETGELIKSYTDETLLVTGGYTTEELIYLERVVLQDGEYVETEPHQIVSSSLEETVISFTTVESETKQEELAVEAAKSFAASAIYRYTAEETGSPVQISLLWDEDTETDYLVYIEGKLAIRFRLSEEAFVYAAENNGILRDSEQNIIYYPYTTVTSFEMDEIPAFDSAILQAKEDGTQNIIEQWQDTVSDKTVYNASGITLVKAEDFAGKGALVLVKLAGGYGLITAYDSDTLTVYNPLTGETSQMSADTALAEYEAAGLSCVLCK